MDGPPAARRTVTRALRTARSRWRSSGLVSRSCRSRRARPPAVAGARSSRLSEGRPRELASRATSRIAFHRSVTAAWLSPDRPEAASPAGLFGGGRNGGFEFEVSGRPLLPDRAHRPVHGPAQAAPRRAVRRPAVGRATCAGVSAAASAEGTAVAERAAVAGPPSAEGRSRTRPRSAEAVCMVARAARSPPGVRRRRRGSARSCGAPSPAAPAGRRTEGRRHPRPRSATARPSPRRSSRNATCTPDGEAKMMGARWPCATVRLLLCTSTRRRRRHR